MQPGLAANSASETERRRMVQISKRKRPLDVPAYTDMSTSRLTGISGVADSRLENARRGQSHARKESFVGREAKQVRCHGEIHAASVKI